MSPDPRIPPLQPIVEGAAVVAVFDAVFVVLLVLLVLATAYVGCWLFTLNDTWRHESPRWLDGR